MTCSASSSPLPAPAPRLTAHQQRRLARLLPTDWLVLLLRQQGWRVGAILYFEQTAWNSSVTNYAARYWRKSNG
ncbi:hypothetical protein KTAU_08430 [Thermogemmatispora aurantia]|uniref:Uncharacterized protein n=1 Tax=Thermogemmatispora aurantia TaxID=2045279 RepID=A0A5J4K3Q4_9CHLR|nr:hypothetical protein KTAU_08430 [Thermogemmatispora aurantia]